MNAPSTHIPLALKYRPQILGDLVGQDTVKRTLSNALKQNQIPPILLLVGPKGTGKTSTARILAKSINCLRERPTLTPCGICECCRSIEVGNSLDVTEIDAASYNGVDDARELIQRLQISPVRGAYRVVILDEAHMLTTAAQNALLKTLEEPPAHVVLIIATTDPQKLLPTVVDRCLDLHFHTLSPAAIVSQIAEVAAKENLEITEGALRAIARSSQGGPRNSLKILDQLALSDKIIEEDDVVASLGDVTGEEIWTLLEAIAQKNVGNLLISTQQLIDQGKQPGLIFNGLLRGYRDLLLIKTDNKTDLLISSIDPGKLQQIADLWGSDRILGNLRELYRRENEGRFTKDLKLWLEIVLMSLLPALAVASPDAPSPFQNDELQSIWQKIMESVRPESRELLKDVVLVNLTQTTATLKAPNQDELKPKKTALSRVIAKTVGADEINIIFQT